MESLPIIQDISAAQSDDYDLASLLDRDQMQVLLDNFCDAVGISAAIIDMQGEVFVGARWQRICTHFHRVHSQTLARCIESDTTLTTQLEEGKNFSIYRCPQGLTDAASPIVINGRHVANAFVGQFLLGEADRDFFRRQAEQYDFDTDEYLKALENVPVVQEERLPSILGFLTGFAEVTATIASERARAADERVHLLLQSTAEGIFGVDINGKIDFVNPAACEMLGFDERELIGQSSHSLIHHHRPDGSVYPADECPMYAAYTRGEASRIDDEFLWRKDGTGIPVEYGSTPIVKDKVVVGAVISFTDITERKLADESSQRNRRLLQSIMDNTDALIYVKDIFGRYLLVNRNWKALLDMPADTVIGRSDEEIFPADVAAKFVKNDERVRGTRKAESIEEMAIVKGEERFFISNKFPLLAADGTLLGTAGVSAEITQIKQMECDLRQAMARAEDATRAKSDFLANMSHEIRTPINGIMGMTELALDTELTREQREFLTTIESSADSLLSLINDILDFSKIEAEKLELDPTDFELRERIGETLVTLAMRAHSKGLELAFDVDPAVPEWVVGDLHRLRQVLMNLLGNAIKFTEQGEIVLRVNVLRQQEQSVTLRFEVSDTGIGLPPDKQESIFRPFEQADASTTRKHGGTGLGLAISVRLVDLMGGKMEVQSELGIGTTFSFTAELAIGSRNSETRAAGNAPPLNSLAGIRVLIVDDNETNRRILAKMLDNWGMVPVVVDSAAKGLAALQAPPSDQPIRLVLSDVNMPEMDGFTFAQELKSDESLRDVPMILLTSANRTGDGARCRKLGIAAHLIKPARQSLLFDAIATSVDAVAPQERPSDRAASPDQSDLTARPFRLLLAEDNATNQKFAVRALTKAGHTVTVANNGQEAVDAWTAERFDAVLMDIQMPVMDGYLATAEIRRREANSKRHTPIIAMTAHAMTGDKEKCLEAGMDGYVTKPIKTKILLAEISRVVELISDSSDSGA